MDEQLRRELSDIAAKIASLEEKVKAAFVRIDEQKELVETVHKLALSMERLTHEQERIRQEQERQRLDVEAMKMKPGKRWEAVVGDVVKLVVAAGVGAVLVRIGLGG